MSNKINIEKLRFPVVFQLAKAFTVLTYATVYVVGMQCCCLLVPTVELSAAIDN